MIYFTEEDLNIRALIQAAYELSAPQGMGFLHATPGPLTEQEIDQVIATSYRPDIDHRVLHLDHVTGRAVKLTLFRTQGTLAMDDDWYYHSEEDLAKLLELINI